MQRRFFLPLLAAAVLATVLLGADRASGAIRITISDGTTDKVFYADGESAAKAISKSPVSTLALGPSGM